MTCTTLAVWLHVGAAFVSVVQPGVVRRNLESGRGGRLTRGQGRQGRRGRGAVSTASASAASAEVPSRWTITKFAAPVAALNLANFAMGSVDTAAVGQFGTTTQLAALAPGTMGMELGHTRVLQ